MANHQKITPVILCGGVGERLWPVSRKFEPKQFSHIVGERSPFQLTLDRVTGDQFDDPVIVSSDSLHYNLLKELAGYEGQKTVLLEPSGKNTAPAIIWAAFQALADEDRSNLLVIVPSDHLIDNSEKFQSTIIKGVDPALEGQIVTFGVAPKFASSSFGYIRVSEITCGHGLVVERFIEKPSEKLAEQYIKNGNYFWNSGIFLAAAETVLALARKHTPDLFNKIQKIVTDQIDESGTVRPNPAAWETIDAISFDYAIMEHAPPTMCLPFPCEWSDIGDWSAIFDLIPSDTDGNRIAGDVTALDCFGVSLRAIGNVHIAALGLRDLMVVAMGDAVLITKNDRLGDLRLIIDKLRSGGVHQLENANTVYRPWGHFVNIENGENFKIKTLNVNPFSKLSLQSHEFRAEHWIVVSGTAVVTLEQNKFEVRAGDTVYIPLGAKHRLANETGSPILLVEVQTGSYFEEDDIERFEDDYDRV